MTNYNNQTNSKIGPTRSNIHFMLKMRNSISINQQSLKIKQHPNTYSKYTEMVQRDRCLNKVYKKRIELNLVSNIETSMATNHKSRQLNSSPNQIQNVSTIVQRD